MSKINAIITGAKVIGDGVLQLELQVADSTKMAILGNGNVLIGTATDRNVRVVIEENASKTAQLAMRNNAISGVPAYFGAWSGFLISSNYHYDSGHVIENTAKGTTQVEGDDVGNIILSTGISGGSNPSVKMKILAGGNVLIGTTTDASTGKIQSAGNVSPSTHNAYDLGTTAVRWKDVWCQTGAFNGSDARLKTAVKPLSKNELEAAKQLAKEIGTYQWLESIEKKGDKARNHMGMTVQRAIQIMEDNGLDAFAYGFIGYDKWEDAVVHHEAVEATEETEAKEPWDEVVLKSGDAFSFRYDQLNQFIARGLEARLTELEARLTILEG